MDYYREAFHLIYLFKQLLEINRDDLVEHFRDYPLTDEDGDVDYDTVFEAANWAIDGVFEHSSYYNNEDKEVSTMVMTDKVMNDFYALAEEYGELNGLSGEDLISKRRIKRPRLGSVTHTKSAGSFRTTVNQRAGIKTNLSCSRMTTAITALSAWQSEWPVCIGSFPKAAMNSANFCLRKRKKKRRR